MGYSLPTTGAPLNPTPPRPRKAAADAAAIRSVNSERNDTVDALRLVAACAIIWFHLDDAPYRRVAYAGLAFFLIVSVVFHFRSALREPWPAYWSKRWKRLLLPWAVWFVIYATANLAFHKPVIPTEAGLLAGVLAGPWIGLWFLPFAFLTGLLIFPMARCVAGSARPQGSGWWLGATACAAATIPVVSLLRDAVILPAPWAQWLQASPSLPLGLALGLAQTAAPEVRQTRIQVVTGAALVASALVAPFALGMALAYSLGVLATSFALLRPRKLPAWVGTASGLCLGVYLVHGLVISALKRIPAISSHVLPWFAGTVIVSFALIWVLRRIPGASKAL
ncbi:MAG: acyltransferase family protein [Verrucomicrobiales bacterium]|nr:acyltransferase family protein [Verrucomicrobiales bacterium]